MPASSARRSMPGGTGPPPINATRSSGGHSRPASSTRPSMVGTSETPVTPSCRAVATAPASNRSCRSTVVAWIAARTRMPSPPTWESGRQHSQRSSVGCPSAAAEAHAWAAQLPCVSVIGRGAPVVPEVWISTAAASSLSTAWSGVGRWALGVGPSTTRSAPAVTAFRSTSPSRRSIGTATAPRRRHPCSVATKSIPAGRAIATLSPSPAPCAASAADTAPARSASAAQVRVSCPAIRAGWSGRRAAALSTQGSTMARFSSLPGRVGRLAAHGRVRRHPLRDLGRRDREDHDRPARGAQRVPAADRDRALGGVRAGARRHLGRRDHPHRRGAARLLLRGRPAGAGRCGVRDATGERRRAVPRHRPAGPDAPAAQADRRHGGRLRGGRRTCAPRHLRPDDRRRQRPLRPDRPQGRLVRRRLRRRHPRRARRPEEVQGDLVPVPSVRRRGGARDGPGQHGRAARAAGGGDGPVVPRDAGAVAVRTAPAQGELQRHRGRPGRPAAARPRHQSPLLRDGRGARGPRGVQGQAQAGLRQVPAAAVGRIALRGSARIWFMAARPRTLPAAIAPVLVGTALAAADDVFHPLTFAATLIGAIFIQVGTNLSNDYSDARRGADTEDRLGPVRVTAGGLVPPRQVLVATYVAFALAVLAGSYLIATAGWELLLVGAASILAGVLYTGGPRPYGYEGLGEVFVFLFFGVVAVTGSYYAQVERLEWEALVLAVPVGLLASAILVVNNVRDLETDRRAGKRTLAVRLGRRRAQGLFAAMVALAFAVPLAVAAAGGLSAWLALSLAALPLAPP